MRFSLKSVPVVILQTALPYNDRNTITLFAERCYHETTKDATKIHTFLSDYLDPT